MTATGQATQQQRREHLWQLLDAQAAAVAAYWTATSYAATIRWLRETHGIRCTDRHLTAWMRARVPDYQAVLQRKAALAGRSQPDTLATRLEPLTDVVVAYWRQWHSTQHTCDWLRDTHGIRCSDTALRDWLQGHMPDYEACAATHRQAKGAPAPQRKAPQGSTGQKKRAFKFPGQAVSTEGPRLHRELKHLAPEELARLKAMIERYCTPAAQAQRLPGADPKRQGNKWMDD